jgi:glutamine synthetase
MSKPKSKAATKAARDVAAFLAAHPGLTNVDAIFADLSGVVRGKRYPIAQLEKIMTDGLAFPASVFLLDTMGNSHDPAGRGFSDGDPDRVALPIPGTLTVVPWADPPACQVMVTLVEADGSPTSIEPRNVLASVVKRIHDMGLRPVVAFELEFYLVDPTRTNAGGPQPPISPLTGQREDGTQVYGMVEVDAYAKLLEEISQACATQGIPTGAITAEYAPGQFEINLQHVADPLAAADQCVMFKRAVKGVARRHGFQATFMPKPYLDGAGSGLHLHVSLIDKQGRNVFDGDDKPASPMLEHAVGGILDILPESMAFLAANVNAYRRFVPNIFVPIRRCWGWENRSVALRIPLGPGAARRIEHRVGGADANPYLALATALAGLHHGITKKIAPPPPFEGNAGYEYDPDLPFRQRRALERLEQSTVLPEYFGADYLRAYVACKLAELDTFENEISRKEYAWYLQAE